MLGYRTSLVLIYILVTRVTRHDGKDFCLSTSGIGCCGVFGFLVIARSRPMGEIQFCLHGIWPQSRPMVANGGNIRNFMADTVSVKMT